MKLAAIALGILIAHIADRRHAQAWDEARELIRRAARRRVAP